MAPGEAAVVLGAATPGERPVRHGGWAAVVAGGVSVRVVGVTGEGVAGVALLHLLLGVGALMPRRALSVLRRPIELPAAPSAVEAAAIRVAAKRWCVVDAPSSARVRVDVGPAARALLRRIEAHAVSGRVGPAAALDLAERAATERRGRGAKPGWDREIGATLVGADGEALLVSRNHASRARVAHAELVLCMTWARAGRSAAAGMRVAVTLQPCRMCAAALVATFPELTVVYRTADPGPMARDTALGPRSVAEGAIGDHGQWPSSIMADTAPDMVRHGGTR